MIRSYEQYIEDISQLTGLTQGMVRYLIKLFRLLVGHEIFEGMVDNKKMESRCMGLGKMTVELDNETNEYQVRFVLSKEMKHVLDKMMDEQKSPLSDPIDKALVNLMVERFKAVIEE